MIDIPPRSYFNSSPAAVILTGQFSGGYCFQHCITSTYRSVCAGIMEGIPGLSLRRSAGRKVVKPQVRDRRVNSDNGEDKTETGEEYRDVHKICAASFNLSINFPLIQYFYSNRYVTQ